MSMTDPAVTVCFNIQIDDKPFGSFTTCEGLGVEVAIEKREEGGNNDFVYQLPGRISYPNIKFSRPINDESSKVVQWLSEMSATKIQRHTATIEARSLDETVVCTWNLMGVILVRWTGPQFNADGPKVATETLELAHHGFLPAASGSSSGSQN
jgi:phage tail-like protein